jgi:allophanate hydrolase subunit 2
MRGPNEAYFRSDAFDMLFSSAYAVSQASDRMGLRLQGPRLERAIEGELPPQGTSPGGLQVPADGQPILLLADRQTTGGYPRIATVIGADIAAVGRLCPGMSVRLKGVSRDEAVRALGVQQAWLASLPKSLKPASNSALTVEKLLSSNLIGGVTAGTAAD